MDETKTAKGTVGNIIDNLGDIINASYKLILIKVVEKATAILSSTIMVFTLVILGFFAFLFITLGAAIWIGDALNDPKLGYFITAGFFVLLAVLICVFRKKIAFRLIRNRLIRKIYE